MTSSEILQTPLLDLLFENRNKAYGAYALRRYYNQRLAIALCVSLAFALLLFVLRAATIKDTGPAAQTQIIDDVIVHTQLIPETPKAPEQPKPVTLRPPAPVAQQQYTQLRIVTDPVSTTDVPTQIDIMSAAISNRTTAGQPGEAVPAIIEPNTAAAAVPAATADAVPAYVAPQFPGGAAAWARFLGRHLQAPEPLEEGITKTVVVKFRVDEDGGISAFEVVQSGGAAFDDEVIRVLKQMPKWKPALKNGQPTTVSFTQPVTFIAMGE